MADDKRAFEAELMALIDGYLGPRDSEKQEARPKRARARRVDRVPYTIEMIHRIIERIQEL